MGIQYPNKMGILYPSKMGIRRGGVFDSAQKPWEVNAKLIENMEQM
jgi:hypothetical protein